MNYAPRNRVWSVAALTAPCVTLSAMRDHLRFPDTSEDALISAKLAAAQGHVERFTQRLLTRRAVTLKLPGLPSGRCPVELPLGEVGAITTFQADGVDVVGVTAFGDSPAVALPAADWPVVTGEVYPVTVAYTAGFLAAPEDLKAAVMLIAAELFERRANAEISSLNEVPLSAQMLMAPHRIMPK